MRKQIYCKHAAKKFKTEGGYTYKLINADLNLCQACELLLWLQMKKQKKVEDWTDEQTGKRIKKSRRTD